MIVLPALAAIENLAPDFMNKTAVAVLVAVFVALAAGGGYWMGQRAPASSNAATAAAAKAAAATTAAANTVTVEAVKVVRASLPQTITAVGSLRSDESITVRPEVAGRISAIRFQEGQRTSKGDTLIMLDPAINNAEVQQARANLTLAKSKYDRSVDLAKSNFISGQAKDEAENNLKVAQAGVTLAEARLAKTEIKAPFSGIIGLRSVSVGDYVKEGADIVNLESIDPLKVDFRVPEMYLTQVKVGQPLTIALDALPGKTFEGRVFAVNPLLDAAGRSVVIRAQVRNADTSLRPGMFARVKLVTRDVQDALVVPEQALVPLGEDQYVFKVVDGKAVRAKVQVGQRRDGKAEIVEGIGPDDTIVSAGQIKLRDGVPVRLAGTPLTAASAETATPPGVPGKADAAFTPAKNGTPGMPKS
ncbi:MAG: efflux RND transporter periplasmic adaptor subunit [Betaproteobacteria bacterium]